jgi:hypothetical protein
LTSKDSFVRKKIIDQNLSYLNSRLTHYLDRMGLPHTVKFMNDLSVNIEELGRELDFDNLSRGERTRLILSMSWAFRDVFESLKIPIQAATSDKPSPVYFGVDLNFKLNPNGKAVDAGVIIPNINDNFRLKAPDLGALELGSPAVIYGARGLKQDQEFWR